MILKKILAHIFILLSLTLSAQISRDSISTAMDTSVKIRRKLSKIYQYSKNRDLKDSDYEFILKKVADVVSVTKEKKDIAYAYYQLGSLYYNHKKLNEAVKYCFKGLEIAETEKDTVLTARLNYKLASVYTDLKNIKLAKKYFYNTLALSNNDKNQEDILGTYLSLGTIYKDEDKLDSALYYQNLALEVRIRMNDKKGIANIYNNIGLVHKRSKDFPKALEYLKKSLAMREEIKDARGVAGANINIGNTYKQMGDNKTAIEYALKGTLQARDAGAGDFFKNGIDALANCYYNLKDYKSAADYRLRYKEAEDSIGKVEMDKQISELSAQYESGKKDAELALQQEQIKSQLAQNSKQKILIGASIIALLMAVIAIFFIYRSFRQNKRNALQLSFKNKLIEEKNREITDSINYARSIQLSLLTPKSVLDKNLKEYFILYKPKDIVSGDFYWGSEDAQGFTIACIDCTGHGVPGAFMSLIGKENLDKAYSFTQSPKDLLSHLNVSVKNSLNQNEKEGSKDGMDAAIVRLIRNENGARIIYAGANRPLWIVRKNALEIEEIKATKHAIGGYTENDQEFKEHEITLYAGDSFYIFTDGYADQFGGEKQKKITTKLFKDILVKNRMTGLHLMNGVLDEYFTQWKGKNEQIDDICVIGVKV